ncbi:GNAT family N-acetyltransferase [Neobacillus sp. DY30]|uniref:GNAT family N-acetyltransferase n=1 Tax=Neobacillus sp. DY30 TaxID=3047871 RepID=UPI0024C026D9|nr:GNAT family N-acetyltransferase [Neobacillus sp. DY30]WHY00280.1 GNAT family N-acetyltransferase [Neobacillus sp. DY30]
MITLKEVNKQNWLNLIKLCSAEDQKNRVFEKTIASNCLSLAQASIEENWTVKAIYKNDTPIGFTMYGYSEELAGYEICRIMIDYKFQGNGYGKQALLLVIKEMVDQFKCEEILITFVPQNEKAKQLYLSVGFKDTGRVIKAVEDELIFSFNSKM